MRQNDSHRVEVYLEHISALLCFFSKMLVAGKSDTGKWRINAIISSLIGDAGDTKIGGLWAINETTGMWLNAAAP